jgi:hypothetical protein
MGRFITADDVTSNWYDPQNLNRYAYARNNPLYYIDPSGHNWFWYNNTWDWQEGTVYHDSKGNEIKNVPNAEILVKFTKTGKNKEGTTTGTIEVWDQNKEVLSIPDAFSGGYDFSAIPNGNYVMQLGDDKRDVLRINKMGESIPNAKGMQLIFENYYHVDSITGKVYRTPMGDSWGSGRIRLNPVDEKMNIIKNPPREMVNLYIHGKNRQDIIYTHGCVCDRSEKLFDYFWYGGAGQDIKGIVPFWVR